jgi:hypothetical protein
MSERAWPIFWSGNLKSSAGEISPSAIIINLTMMVPPRMERFQVKISRRRSSRWGKIHWLPIFQTMMSSCTMRPSCLRFRRSVVVTFLLVRGGNRTERTSSAR